MRITKTFWGKTSDGEDCFLFTIKNKHGMSVVVSNLGATIISINVPDRDGNSTDVVLGYNSFKDYVKNESSFGAFVGRVANRISGAKFTVGGKEYTLDDNDNGNCLHSGKKRYSSFTYDYEINDDTDEPTIEFSRLSPDGEQGFPGNLDHTVQYTLTNDNELVIEYFANSDADTPINFTNHSYFNLNGHGKANTLNHLVTINADQFTPAGKDILPTGEFRDVDGTPMDFRKPVTIGDGIFADYEPLRNTNGYDTNFVINHTEQGGVEKCAEVYSPDTGIIMEVFTDLPGVQLYSTNSMDTKKVFKDNVNYNLYQGLCFETQFFPNTINTPEFETKNNRGYIKAGEEFETTTIYKFSSRKH
jgi:aldose 1-epimerase